MTTTTTPVGWRCPVCGRGLNPAAQFCDHGGVLPVYPPLFPAPFPTATRKGSSTLKAFLFGSINFPVAR